MHVCISARQLVSCSSSAFGIQLLSYAPVRVYSRGVLVKSQGSGAGSQHVLLGRPAFAFFGAGFASRENLERVDGDQWRYGCASPPAGAVSPGDEVSGPEEFVGGRHVDGDSYAVECSFGSQSAGDGGMVLLVL